MKPDLPWRRTGIEKARLSKQFFLSVEIHVTTANINSKISTQKLFTQYPESRTLVVVIGKIGEP